jgi:hypothetical protein
MFLMLYHVRHAGMWIHVDNSAVCNAAISALVNVSVKTNQVSEITSDDLDAIVNVMSSHQNVKDIQEKALILLKNLSFSRENIIVMEQNPHLVSVIRSASSTWQTNFEDRVDYLLCVLPATNQ